MSGKVEKEWIGQVLNRNFRIDSVLGKGGQATIFKGKDLILEETIAIKLFHKKAESNHLERFKREARHQMKLSHKNIVSIRSIIEENEQYFIVMEYVDGSDLGHLISVSEEFPRLPLYQVKVLFSEVLDALGHAHSHDVVHRDIKPPNIMLTQDYKVKLADFGLARQLQDQRLTMEGQLLGTPAYTAPEILQGASTLDPRCDIYSVGVSLYETLCGTTPFLNLGETLAPFELLGRHMFMEPESPTEKGILIPKALDDVVMKSIAKDPDERFSDCASFKRVLMEALDEETEEATNKRPSRRNNDTTIVLRSDFAEEEILHKAKEEESGNYDAGERTLLVSQDWEQGETALQVEAIPTFLQPEKVQDHDSDDDMDFHATVVSVGIPDGADSPLAKPFSDTQTSSPHTEKKRLGAPFWLLFLCGISLIGAAIWFMLPKQSGDRLQPINVDRLHSRPLRQRPKKNHLYPQKIQGVQMVFVPSGAFLQGMNRTRRNSTFSPQRKVTLRAFWIDKFEVTVGLYRICVRAGVCRSSQDLLLVQQPKNAPVVRVTWKEADTFCRWMGKHLPSESQWEKAARSQDGRRYPWGNRKPTCDFANRCGCSDRPLEVGLTRRSLGRSRYGAYDMSGNVWEWTQDCFSQNAYRTLPHRDPVMKRNGCTSRVLRGGSWKCGLRWGLFSYTRRRDFYKLRKADIGFRCAWTVR